jgi:hypothetical protein
MTPRGPQITVELTSDIFHTSFIYTPASDSWQWVMDDESGGKLSPFARVTSSGTSRHCHEQAHGGAAAAVPSLSLIGGDQVGLGWFWSAICRAIMAE